MIDKIVIFWERHKRVMIGFALIVFFVLLSVRTENTRERITRVEREVASPITVVSNRPDKSRTQVQNLVKSNAKITARIEELERQVDRLILLNPTQGPEGKQGGLGPQGLDGNRGSSGARGSQGATGSRGPAGPQGPTGATGAPGKSLSLQAIVEEVTMTLDKLLEQKLMNLLKQLGLIQ